MVEKRNPLSVLAALALLLCLFLAPLPLSAEDQGTTIRVPDLNLKVAIKTEGDITVKDMQALTTLKIVGKPIKSLEGLQFATNLQELQICDAGLKDIKTIGQLSSLTILDLSTNSINDISPLANLTRLTMLNLGKNQVKNLTPLQNLTLINDLNLKHNEISDINPLSNLFNLDKLNLEENNLTDISILSHLNKNNTFKMGDQIQLGNNELNMGEGTNAAQVIDAIKGNHVNVVWEPQKRIQLSIDGKLLNLSAAPVVISNRTMVPVRAIFESLGATVQWNASTRTVTGSKDSINIILTVNNKIAKVNGKNVMLDVPATIVNNSVMVPTRFIAETFGKQVTWEAQSRTVVIK